jgi:TonB-linked SusC/RagA family outer membrane protein
MHPSRFFFHLTHQISQPMKKFLFMVLVLVTALLQQAVAQDRTVSGRIIDRNTNEGLPGATVLVKGTTVGTAANADGSFSITVPSSATTLEIRSVGYSNIDQTISDGPMTITLVADSKQLNEVVVTALGVERTRNSLAYSATQVEGNDITVARNPSAINGLSGKVAGLTITQSNTLGGSSNVVIRGTKSLTGNNQALFVVDGVPISNSNTNNLDQRTGRSGYDYGNAAADINPDDIASTTVLKGAAATALYGERAANGVIIITTKKGRKGLGVTVNSGVTLGKIDKSTFIKYQKKYGAGYGKYYNDDTGYFNTVNPDGTGGLVAPTSEDASYGAPFNGQSVLQWGAYTPGSSTFGKATPWVAGANDPSTFFQTAVSTLNSIVIDGGNDNGTFKLGYTNNNERGVLPNSQISKNIINLGASYNVTSRLTTSANVNFTRLVGLGRYGTGYGSENLMTNFRQWWQTNVDIKEQKEAYDRNNTNATWNFASPESGNLSAIYWNNPYFVRYKNYENDSRFRTFGNVMANYKVADWFSVMGRVTMDSYDEQQEERSAVGSTMSSYPSYYRRFNNTYREFNFDLIGNFNKNITEDISFRGLLGANMRRQYTKSLNATTLGGLVVPDLYTLTNAQSGNTLEETDVSQGLDGLFASTTFGFRERIFLDLTIRQDKSTTLPTGNNTYVYPAASLGYVFSESLRDVAPWLSYGKARVNYAQVGSSADPQRVYDVYRKPQAFGPVALFAVNGTKNNADLKPEITKSGEIGLELAFFQSRLGVEFNAYQQNTINQIFPVSVSVASGYNFRVVNSGEVS